MKEKKRDLKRRDKKGRILRNGESQRADGRYAYVYTDCFGKQKFYTVGSWRRLIHYQQDADHASL